MLGSPHPVADSSAVVCFGDARFTVLTDRLIRMEWSKDGMFEDRATLTVLNRRFPVPDVDHRVKGSTLTLTTPALTLTYQDTGRPFSARSLSVRYRMAGTSKAEWKPGRANRGNLGGTFRTLDGADGETFEWCQHDDGHWMPNQNIPVDLGQGVVSRDGFFLHDDSGAIVLDPEAGDGIPWVTSPRTAEVRDWYLFAHGLDFRGALRDAAGLFGASPLPPRYVFGYWYSRYWAYTDRELEELADRMDELGIPLDVMVIDMDWHLPGWTGYTWDRRYFPDPGRLLDRLRQRGLRITLNLHPADGIAAHEDAFPEACRRLGYDPATTDRIPFDCTDPAFMKVYFTLLHHPHEDLGVDFWWLDWQQGRRTRLAGLDPLPWLNHLHWTDQETRRPRKRPLCFSRYGGPGAGRYPVGFSGDTFSTWDSLAYQPRFTATAANVLYGYWSHDIGGHQPGPVEPELYTRWMQYGVVSPILRTHSGKSRASDRRVWRFEEPYSGIMMDAIRERYRMAPYLYTEARKASDTGIAMIRALYIDHPRARAAYTCPGQYAFGDEQVAHPVTAPGDDTGLTRQASWLPPGTWYNRATGHLERGGRTVTHAYLLADTPLFARAGVPLPGQAGERRLSIASPRHLDLDLIPGGNGRYRLYEDDGDSTGYREGACAWIDLAHRVTATTRSCTVGPAEGSFRGFRRTRTVTFRFAGMAPPASVRRGTARLDATEPGSNHDGWWYDGDTGTVVVTCSGIDLTRPETITVRQAKGRILPNGWKGLMARLREIGNLANLVSPAHPMHPEERLAIQVGQTGRRLTLDPGSYDRECASLRRDLRNLPAALEGFQAAYARHGRNEEAVRILARARALLDATAAEYRL